MSRILITTLGTSNSWAEPIRQLRRELGLSPINYNPLIENKFSPDLVIALFSSVLGQPQPDWPANTVVAGFTFYDGTQDSTEFMPVSKAYTGYVTNSRTNCIECRYRLSEAF
ncbi:hypothetical protein [Nostoc parmelioides]|uniref:hypothetical protein n=1 Tax=Nostoc parmelioides TaxID=1521621 RepID=UPI001F54C61E|nr:hypothetical protein [Nostoc parmelioides]